MEIPYTEYSGLNHAYYDSIDNILWFTSRDHIWIFDLNSDSFLYDVSDRFDGFGIDGLSIASFFLDDAGRYWVVGDDGILHVCDREEITVRRIDLPERMDIPVVMEQSGNTVWILSRNGVLAGYDTGIGTFRSVLNIFNASAMSGLPSRMELVSTSDGDMWIMYDRELAYYDADRKSLEHIRKIHLDGRDLYTSITIDDRDNLWVGTARSGVSIIDGRTMEVMTLPYLRQTNGKRIWHHTDISKIYADSRGGIWIATLAEGLLYWHRDIYHLRNRYR